MKNKSLIIGGIIVIIAIIAIIAVVKLNQEKPIEIEKNMSGNGLVGKWNAISEETISGLNEDLSGIGEYSITFYEDGSYSQTIAKVKTDGFYVTEEDKITLYNSRDQIGKEGSFNSGWFEIKDNELTITLPKYPKTVIYAKA